MATYAALLRAVNLAGHNPLPMTALRALATSEGLGNPRTLLQSGNLIFETITTSTAVLEQRLESGARSELGLATEFMIRSKPDLLKAIAANPFPDAAVNDPGHLVLMFLKTAPRPAAVKTLQSLIKGRETVRAHGAHLFMVYPDGIGRSRLTTALVERALETRGTGRNWNTVLKVRDLMSREAAGGGP